LISRSSIGKLQDGQLTGDTEQAQEIAQTPIMLRSGILKPDDDPERFTRSLHLAYHGSRMWAIKARETKMRRWLKAVLAVSLIGTPATAMAGIDGADLALAEARLAEAAQPAPHS
jgi:hypothetical protein